MATKVYRAAIHMSIKDYLEVSERVCAALKEKRAIVALESTIITHGMPYPQNLETALMVEQEVRQSGAEPATIAIMDGRLVVGVEGERLEYLAAQRDKAAKASRRDMAAVLVKGGNAGTTVAATMIIAAAAKIDVFATGGIGGVHRGASETFDVSADLNELAQTPVAVVCAGAKSILDIGKTLEVLETSGVPVLGYRTDEFPAFFAISSGFPVDQRFDEVADIAKVIKLQKALGMGGILVANPIPEADALDGGIIEKRIAQAIKDAGEQGIERKALTPYLLQRIFELSEGKSLKANIALIKNNARLAAQIALSLSGRN